MSHVSTKTCVTGNNLVLHKALARLHLELATSLAMNEKQQSGRITYMYMQSINETGAKLSSTKNFLVPYISVLK